MIKSFNKWGSPLFFAASLVILFIAYSNEASAQTAISACGTISSSGSYILTADLTTTSDCLVVSASDVTIDLNGHFIEGDQGALDDGISVFGILRGIVVRNGTVRNFGNGVALGANSVVENMRVFDNLSVGIQVASSGVAKDNISSGNGVIGIFAGQGSTVSGNTVNGNTAAGISVNCPSNIIGNTATGNNPNFTSSGKMCKMTENLF